MYNATLRNAFTGRIRQGQQHTGHVIDSIDQMHEVGMRLNKKIEDVTGDRNLTPTGARSAIADYVKGTLAKEFAQATRAPRKALAHFARQQEAFAPPKPQRPELAAEIRSYVRSMSVGERFGAAANPDMVDAVLDAPPALSGLPPAVFEQIRQGRLEQVHGAQVAELTANAGDYENAAAMATTVKKTLAAACGMYDGNFDLLMQPLEAEADR